MNEALKNYIKDLKCDQEELEEGGDLEDRLDLALEIDRAERLLAAGKAKYYICGLCGGSGNQNSYEDHWDCPACQGRGGNWE